MSFKVNIECGEKTCYSKPKCPCRLLSVRDMGTLWVCNLFNRILDEDENNWLLRCEECLEEEKKEK
jgi:hypothetical protein